MSVRTPISRVGSVFWEGDWGGGTEVNLWKQGSDPKGKKPLENPPENQLEISYTGKSPKIGSLDIMS